MSTYLVIGPSGAGKSCAAKNLAENRVDIQVLDLDKEIRHEIDGASVSQHLEKIGNKGFFELSKALIDRSGGNPKSCILIIVGAGSINYPEGYDWYLQQQLIALTGNPTILYERGNRQKFHQTLDHYISSEFSEGRKHLYQNAKFKIDVTDLTVEQVANEISKIMDETDVGNS